MHSARPPPARPHIGIHSTYSSKTGDWAEEDAWDSGSDEDSPRQSSSSQRTAPKPVPLPKSSYNTSSSTLAFSYTHVTAPNPSSYPPRETLPKNGWTIVKTKSGSPPPSADDRPGDDEGRGDADVEDMILGDLEPEAMEPMDIIPPTHSKPKTDQGIIREDAEDIVNGEQNATVSTLALSRVRSAVRCQASTTTHGRTREPPSPHVPRKC